ERHADAPVAPEQARAAARDIVTVCGYATGVMGGIYNQVFWDWEDRHPGAWDNALRVCDAMEIAAGLLVREAAGMERDRPDEEKRRPEQLAHCNLLRCIFGNPFRPASIESACLTTTVVSLAQAIYEDRAFDRMPVLGDALEEAGCGNREILDHCRSAQEHV